MSRVLTNNVTLRYAREASIGTLPGTPKWRLLEPNNITQYGDEITTVARRPISPVRGRKKGTVVDRESGVAWEADLTVDAFTDFAEGFVFAEFANVEFDLKSGTGTLPPPVATTSTYTIDSASALLAGKVQFSAASYATLVYAKGYTNAANNGLKEITADLAPAGTAITVAATLVVETPPTSASLQIAGVRVLDDADLTLTVSGSTATLVSAAAITNWATLGLRAGMFIHIGSSTVAGAVQNALGAGGTTSFGYARITSISGATLNLDKLDVNLSTATGPVAGSQDIMFGRFVRNVSVEANSDDNRYLEQTYQFEAAYPDLGGIGTDEYEYSLGNFANELVVSIPLSEKATATWGFVGTVTEDITASRKTGAVDAVSPLRTTAINTSSDIAALTTDVVSSASDVCFKDLTLTIRNNVTPEKCLGELGAVYVNSGLFEVELEGQMLFTRKEIVNAVKSNQTVTFLSILKNEDGAIVIDLPTLTFGDGSRELPVDESVLVNLTGSTFTSPTLGYDVGINVFASVPTIRP